MFKGWEYFTLCKPFGWECKFSAKKKTQNDSLLLLSLQLLDNSIYNICKVFHWNSELGIKSWPLVEHQWFMRKLITQELLDKQTQDIRVNK